MFGMQALWNSVSKFFESMFRQVWSGFREMVTYIPGDLFESSFLGQFTKTKEEWDSLLQYFQERGIIDERTAGEIKKQYDVASPFDTFTWLFVLFTLSYQYTSNQAAVISRDMLHNLNAEYGNVHPMPQDVINAAFIAPSKTSEIRQIMLEQGFSEDKIDLIFLALYRTIDESTLQTLYLRGDIDREKLYTRMRELGYTDSRISEIVSSWEERPPITDLVRFAYRNLFSRETRERWPWMYEAPDAFVSEMAKTGMSEYWASLYWAAHWRQPGLRDTFEMLHRGFIREDDVRYALEARGYSEYWQDRLMNISWRTYTRVDTRRMNEMGILDAQGVFESYQAQGYDSERAKNMTEFTLRYNQKHHRDITRSQIEDAFKGHLITGVDAKDLLQDIDFLEEEADFLVEFWQWEKDREYENRQIDNIGERYKKNLIDSGEARARLGRLNLDSNRVDILLDEWSLDKMEDIKTPSKSDLDKFYKNDIINLERYEIELRRLGYNAEYTNWYLQLARAKKAG